jgi:signal transduction histidine kinase
MESNQLMGGSILIVDDNPDNLRVLEQILTADGHKVRAAVNGEIALKAVAARLPDLILLDILMPGMDGFEVCRCLKENPTTVGVPVLFISALTDTGDKLRAFDAGGIDYISKPFEEKEVLARVRTHLMLAAAHRHLLRVNRELCREVEARKSAEEKAVRSVSLLRATLESTADGILVVDRAGRIVDSNERFLELWNIPGNVIVSQDDDVILTYVLDQLKYPDEFIAKVRELYDQPEEESLDVLCFRDGRVFERYSRPQRVDNLVTGRVWSFRDITELKRIEEERLVMERRLLHSQKMESLVVLVGGIAHDFNNLLMGIMGNLDLTLLKLPPDIPVRSNIKQALDACKRAAKLVRQMLDYAGKGNFVLSEIDLNDVICANAPLFRAVVARNVDLTIATAPALPTVMADQGQLQQVIMNLVINASEAIGANPGVITISTGIQDCDDAYLGSSRVEEKPPPGCFVYLEVSDTGCGMDNDTKQRIFDPFFTTNFMGRGLGMSEVLGIVRAHNGAVMVESEKGEGSFIRMLYPVCREEKAHSGRAGDRNDLQSGDNDE